MEKEIKLKKEEKELLKDIDIYLETYGEEPNEKKGGDKNEK